jgi:hypothetical protein
LAVERVVDGFDGDVGPLRTRGQSGPATQYDAREDEGE